MKRDYGNIQLVQCAHKPQELKENEYYILMVTDEGGKEISHRPKRDYADYDYAFIGIECTGGNRRYISKHFDSRHDTLRGVTIIATVSNPELECMLS